MARRIPSPEQEMSMFGRTLMAAAIAASLAGAQARAETPGVKKPR